MSNKKLKKFLDDLKIQNIKDYAGSITTEVNVKHLINTLMPIDVFYPPFQRNKDIERINRLVNEQKDEFMKKKWIWHITYANCFGSM